MLAIDFRFAVDQTHRHPKAQAHTLPLDFLLQRIDFASEPLA